MRSATKIQRKVVSKSQHKSKWSLIADPRRKPWPRTNNTSSCLSNTWLDSMALSRDPSLAQRPRRRPSRSQTTPAPPCNRLAYATSNRTLTSLTTQAPSPVMAKAIVADKANAFLKGSPITSTSSHKRRSQVTI